MQSYSCTGLTDKSAQNQRRLHRRQYIRRNRKNYWAEPRGKGLLRGERSMCKAMDA